MAYLGNTPTTQSFISGTDYFNGDGSTTAFTLSRSVVSVNDIEVVINNVVQQPNTAYTISGTTITFTSAPSAGTANIYVRYLSTTTQSITPSQNTVSYSTLNSDNQSKLGISFKNRLINGGMVIDQRNAGASTTPTTNATFSLDRWKNTLTQSSKYSIQQNAGSVTPPAGFSNYLGVTSTSSYSVLSTDVFGIQQGIEGYNIADLNWGTVNAKTITLSFWVRSSLTGTFGGSITDSNGVYTYVFQYTINTANTWEQKSITIAGPTSGGTWGSTNGAGFYLSMSLGSGSVDSTSTPNTWLSGAFYIQPTGAVNIVGTSGATWYITGFQMEVGTQATTFDYRSYGTELQLCQRYYWNIKKGNFTGVTNVAGFNTTDCYGVINFPVYMRTGPTGAYSSLSAFRVAINGAQPTPSAITFQDMTVSNCVLDIAASVTAGAGGWLSFVSSATSTDYISWSAEL